ncbi:MAG TPA: Nif3-like dinuclear metal center hexameric protein [Ohtaekwangia sp.]|nr:Nif3-like dinuclear metal center hexameric protein [Ohtaekwangia sp.]
MTASIMIKDVTDYLETLAPRAYQESYDNAGLICGNPTTKVTGILVSLDCIEAVVQEAIDSGCNLVVAHHPIVFRGLKKITGSNYVERTLLKAIKNDIAIYAIHTNLDNVHQGVNRKIAEKIGLRNLRILDPKKGTLSKLVTFVPKEYTDAVLAALHEAGAGQIGNYKNCSFQIAGKGNFKPTDEANPFVGEAGHQEQVDENRVELVFPNYLEAKVIQALRNSHPYEEVAYYITAVSNVNQEVGSGMIGELEQEMEPLAFLDSLKRSMAIAVIRHTSVIPRKVKKVALCGGAGSFLVPKAIQAGADVFISADFKYHEFFDAEERLIIADIGHYESEVYTKDLLQEVLIKKFPTFAINFSKTVTNPISYL